MCSYICWPFVFPMFVNCVLSFLSGVRPDHQSCGSPLSSLIFLVQPSSYLPDNSCSVSSLGSVSSKLHPVPFPPCLASPLSPLFFFLQVSPDDLIYSHNSVIFSTLIILKSLYPTMTSFQMFKPTAPTVYFVFSSLHPADTFVKIKS